MSEAFLFPGQGAQFPGMGSVLRRVSAGAAELFARADEILGFPLSEACAEGPQERLDATDVAQPALYVCSLAALEALKERQPERVEACRAAAGLSLGEYTALTFAGVLSFEDGLRLVRRRGQAMQAAAEAVPSGMCSVIGLDAEAVEALCRPAAEQGLMRIANYLCRGNYAVSGAREAIQALIEHAEAEGIRVVPLKVAGAFHTEIMQPAVAPLREAMQAVEFRKPRLPVYLNVDAQPHEDPDEIRELLGRQVVEPVQWERSVAAMAEHGIERFLEVGPGTVLKGMIKRIVRGAKAESFGDPEAEAGSAG